MIKSKRLNIRPIQQSDLINIIPIHSDELVNKYLPYDTWQTNADAQAWYDRIETLTGNLIDQQFIIELLLGSESFNKSELIGTCLYMNHDKQEHSAEFGYVLGSKYWRQGYMYEAMTAFISYLTNDLAILSLKASIDTENIASIKLIKKLGFTENTQNMDEKNEGLVSFSMLHAS